MDQLLQFGASLSPRGGGWDALMAAAAGGGSDTVDTLLAKGLRWDRKNNYHQDCEV